MAITITESYNSEHRAVERDPVELVFDVDGGTAVSTTQVALATLPAGSIVTRVQIHCIGAHAGSGNCTFNLKQGTTLFFTGDTDNGGAVGNINNGANAVPGTFEAGKFDPTAFPLANDTVINAEVINTSTTSGAGKARITICAFRPTF